jgi:hypothetical protein
MDDRPSCFQQPNIFLGWPEQFKKSLQSTYEDDPKMLLFLLDETDGKRKIVNMVHLLKGQPQVNQETVDQLIRKFCNRNLRYDPMFSPYRSP